MNRGCSLSTRLGGAVGPVAGLVDAVGQVVPPVVAVGGHRDLPAGAADDHDVLDGGAVGQGLVDVRLERDLLPPPPAAVGGDDEFGPGVVVAVGDRLGAEPAEDDRVHRPQPRAGQHGDRQFGHHRHVQRDAVPLLDAQPLQHVGEPADFAVQFAVGQRAGVARLPLPQDRRLVLPPRGQVPVQTLHAGVEPPADEPLGVGHRAPHHRVEVGLPRQFARPQFAPEPDRVVFRPLPHPAVLLFALDVGVGGELLRRGEGAVLLQDRLDPAGAPGGRDRFLAGRVHGDLVLDGGGFGVGHREQLRWGCGTGRW